MFRQESPIIAHIRPLFHNYTHSSPIKRHLIFGIIKYILESERSGFFSRLANNAQHSAVVNQMVDRLLSPDDQVCMNAMRVCCDGLPNDSQLKTIMLEQLSAANAELITQREKEHALNEMKIIASFFLLISVSLLSQGEYSAILGLMALGMFVRGILSSPTTRIIPPLTHAEYLVRKISEIDAHHPTGVARQRLAHVVVNSRALDDDAKSLYLCQLIAAKSQPDIEVIYQQYLQAETILGHITEYRVYAN